VLQHTTHMQHHATACLVGRLSFDIQHSHRLLSLSLSLRLSRSLSPSLSPGQLLYVQCVYSPVVSMMTYRNGFVALCQQGAFIREVFQCPARVGPEHNPLKNIRAQYRLTSQERTTRVAQTPPEPCDFNPSQLNFSSMLRDKPSATCVVA